MAWVWSRAALLCPLLCALLGAAPRSATATPPRRNLLLIITDDQRWDILGVVNPSLHTPEMDRLARSGVRFSRAYATTPICAASRASILTGLVERSHQYTFKTPPLAQSLIAQTYPALLRSAGYRTGYVGKLGVELPAGAADAMWNSLTETHLPYWKKQPDGSSKHLSEIEGDAAIAFLEQHARDGAGAPFALTLGFNAPHAEDSDPEQYHWQKEVDALYRTLDIPLPPTGDPSFFDQTHPYLRDETMNRARWHWRFDGPKRVEMTRAYYRMVSGVDRVIGRVLEKLRGLGLERDTVVVLLGDNGYFLGERGYADKWLPYEPSARIPLIVQDPTGQVARAGLVIDAFALNIDVAPTLLDVAGVPIPAGMQGRSLIPLARGQKVPGWRHDVWLEHLMQEPTIRKHEGVRDSRYKYIRYFEANPILEELYDLQEDPLETVNLVRSPKLTKLLDGLRRRTDELRDAYGGPFPLSTTRPAGGRGR